MIQVLNQIQDQDSPMVVMDQERLTHSIVNIIPCVDVSGVLKGRFYAVALADPIAKFLPAPVQETSTGQVAPEPPGLTPDDQIIELHDPDDLDDGLDPDLDNPGLIARAASVLALTANVTLDQATDIMLKMRSIGWGIFDRDSLELMRDDIELLQAQNDELRETIE